MAEHTNNLTTQDFAKKAGVSAGTVSKWLREGTISGTKISGKWSIPMTELAKVAPQEKPSDSKPVAKSPSNRTENIKSGGKSYSIQEFTDMTYLTEFGVLKWLKEGRLKQVTDSKGQIRVDASCMDDPYIKRLIR